MKLNFGQITEPTALEDCPDAFTDVENLKFDYQLEVNDDDVILRDAVGRMVPIDYASAVDLYMALHQIVPSLVLSYEGDCAKDYLTGTDEISIVVS